MPPYYSDSGSDVPFQGDVFPYKYRFSVEAPCFLHIRIITQQREKVNQKEAISAVLAFRKMNPIKIILLAAVVGVEAGYGLGL